MTENGAAEPAAADVEHKEALQYWGYLFKADKCGTDLFNRLLAGIANYIHTHFEPSHCPDLSPSQLAAFYRAVGGNYDALFVETLPSSIGFIYKSLGCMHSLQPGPEDDGYATPSVPALKSKGFITWQTIQLLLGPEEHVPFLQNAVKQFDLIDPADGKPFPKMLPKEAFPERPDQAMVEWYDSVSERLRREAETAHIQRERTAAANAMSDDDAASEDSPDGRSEAAQYFSNPLYRDREGRPGILRHSSRSVFWSFPISRRRTIQIVGEL
ncbi:hypothetical protein K402DRAFT_341399 [Aulographum hederae CBS 113979]|uniref:DUF7514 domain-containing protein n=1 Tax=Aulographum hederae CBS 113979 TaxID=1176131 RepID=A0A6G1GM94_9PEZI|nr:hypothetical protein K402DRAFT_341399 [Aulographum hederae CBS 113979]